MKVHYINILLFALSLNILVHNQRNHKSPTQHTPKTLTNRSLCECELYAPANYDNDPQMKEVMENFNKQTQQRFHEYDDRMVEKRKQCKEQCDKESQKIILKDKLEKQMTQQLTTLETKIDTDDISTCVCEKSMADKVEKGCLNCGKNMGAIAPWWGLVCGAWYAGWTNYFATTVVKMATDAGIAEGVKVGLVNVAKVVTKLIEPLKVHIPVIDGAKLITLGEFTDEVSLEGIFKAIDSNASGLYDTGDYYNFFSHYVKKFSTNPESYATQYSKEIAEVVTAFDSAKAGVLAEGTSKTSSLTTGITASVVAIVVIVLIMVIIYLILRYRRKKKMKKKLQYIKLLEQ
ncbi:rifin [Plasmodium reichenowi]|uniref:Rifin n=1 Tax=Plasmodium reichenowi TaxID=5854 RepID=A0A060RQY1_PLARE|nr:rifin [Plasmodium reichenowi]